MVVCQYFLKGKCLYGTKCRNLHSVPYGFKKEREVCQYFLKGSCGYGDRCFKEHPTRDIRGFDQLGKESFFAGCSTRNENTFRPVSPFGDQNASLNRPEVIQHSMESDAEKVVQLIHSKVQSWEVSKIWPLSCFGGYLREKSCFAGLQDFSPEELRIAAYEAVKANRSMHYMAEVGRLVQDRKERKKELSKISVHGLKEEEEKGCQVFQNERDVIAFKANEGAATLIKKDSHFQGSRSLFSLPETKHSNLSSCTSALISNNPAEKGFQKEPDLSIDQYSSQLGVTNNPIFKSSGIHSLELAFNNYCSSVDQGLSTLGKQEHQDSRQQHELFSSRTSAVPGEVKLNPFAIPQGLSTDTHTPQGLDVPLKAKNLAPNTELVLSDKDICSFKAEHFVLGQIPEIPPPPERY